MKGSINRNNVIFKQLEVRRATRRNIIKKV